MNSSGAPTVAAGQQTRDWAATIPSSAVDSTGVDYYLESVDAGGAVVTSPAGVVDASIRPYHVSAVSPPVITHVPPAFVPAGNAVTIDAKATCSTGSCTAKLFYRESPASGSDIHLTGAPNWPSVAMNAAGSSSLGDVGEQINFVAEIPESVVTTRGVDYVIQVKDGSTTSYWPGTTYEGVVPVDGT